ncbi:MAG: hypothetical protein JWN90_290 [Parcubacteria group bacterium]|nr:hypothetical protein [Parcubacteria group bacterium]
MKGKHQQVLPYFFSLLVLLLISGAVTVQASTTPGYVTVSGNSADWSDLGSQFPGRTINVSGAVGYKGTYPGSIDCAVGVGGPNDECFGGSYSFPTSDFSSNSYYTNVNLDSLYSTGGSWGYSGNDDSNFWMRYPLDNGDGILLRYHRYSPSSWDSQLPSNYYAQIKNTSAGSATLYDVSSTTANAIKTLPEDWIVYVGSTTDASSSPYTADGFNWFQVIDPTDNVSGWMKGEDASSTTHYLQYANSQQAAFEASSSDYVATSSRPWVIQSTVDHYYNNTSTSNSLYSSDNGATGYKISQLKNGGYPEELILGIAAQEDGGATLGFNNENISSDYGHGIFQITFSPSYPFDNRGVSSKVKVYPCSLTSDLYLDCYTSTDGVSPYLRHYKPYAGNGSNPTYKQYANTGQSIYANTKDALYLLAHNYYLFSSINTSTTTNGVTYSADERKDILATQYYNGGNDDACRYVDAVASRLDSIDSYFPDATSSSITTLVEKMHSAGTDVVCADLHSPGDLSIQDNLGRTVGMSNDVVRNDFPLAVYDSKKKYAVVLAAGKDEYTYTVKGTGTGTYGLDIKILNDGKEISFNAKDIAMLPGEIHTYSINKTELLAGKQGVTLKVDRSGTGKIDRVVKAGKELKGEAYVKEATEQEKKAYSLGDPPGKVVQEGI